MVMRRHVVRVWLLLVVGVVKEGGHDGGWKGEPAKIRGRKKVKKLKFDQ
jgi:hypothetical protein